MMHGLNGSSSHLVDILSWKFVESRSEFLRRLPSETTFRITPPVIVIDGLLCNEEVLSILFK
jgi:hypothetical protein